MIRRLSTVLVALATLLLVSSHSAPLRSQAVAPPILVVTNTAATNPYGQYLPEILRAEGINTFQTADLSTVTSTSLAGVQLVVLAETPLLSDQAATLSNYVSGGGRIVAMRPDTKLLPALGLTALGSSTAEGYIGINAGSSTGAGFTTTTLPFHGTASNYSAGGGATTLATLYSNQTTATAFPAVVRVGNAVTFAYDLARSVVYTRQGNPANSGVVRDGIPGPVRTTDVFYNAIDKDRVSIPHADIQMRLFARAVADLLADVTPLPQLWYFPNAAKTLLIVTGDSHANPQSYFDAQVAALNARNIKGTFYIFNGAAPSVASVQTWRSQGHEIGMHPAAFSRNRTLDQAFQDNQNYFSAGGYGTPSPTTRIHQVQWLNWVDAAKVEAAHGVSMDTSFYTWGPTVAYADSPKHQANGYINGSGQLMRFIDQTGAIVPTWGLVTSLADEQLIVETCGTPICSEQLTGTQALAVSKQLIDASQAGNYAAIMTQFHVDYFGWGDVQTWALGTMDYANSLSIPNRTAQGFLAYTTARAATTVTGLSWAATPKQLSFTAAVPVGAEAQTMSVPTTYAGSQIVSVQVNGVVVPLTTQLISGRSASMFSVPASASGVPVVVTYGGGTASLSIADLSTTEGTGGVKNATFTVTLSPVSNVPVTVGFITADGTATAPGDYAVTSGTLTFPANTATQTIAVPLVTDSTPEPDETFTVTLSNPTNAVIGRATATGTILNDDLPLVSIGNASVAEGNAGTTPLTFTATLSAVSSQTVTVNWATASNTATGGTDYTAASGTVTFNPGVTSQPITVSVLGDTTFEANETFFVNLNTPANATIGTGQGVGTITNDDTAPTVSINSVSAPEGNAGTTTLTFTATLSAVSGVNATVAFATANGTATAGSDFTAASGTLTFAPGTVTQPIPVSVTGDTTFEANETFTVNLSTPTGATIAVGQGTGTGTITNDDAAPTVSINSVAVTEGNTGTTPATFTVSLSAVSGVNATVAYTTADGTATAGSDYTAVSGTLTIAAGTLSQPLTVSVIGDTVYEPNETFLVNLSAPANASLGTGQGTGTITNDDPVPPTPLISINNVTLPEGNSGTTNAAFSVTLSNAAAQTVTVNYITANGTATAGSDYTAASGTLTFAPGSTSQPLTVPVIGDTTYEATETFVVNLSAPVNAALGTAQGVGTITNDDAAPAISIANVSANEGNTGTTPFTFTVSLSAASGLTTTVAYTTADGTATAGSDYTAASGTLTFAPGTLTQPIVVAVTGDTTFESNETFTVNLSVPVNATVSTPQATGTIVNDDPLVGPTTISVQVSASSDDANEEGTTFDASSSSLWIGNGSSATASYLGLRFANLAIPPGATITSAHIEVNAAATQWISLGFQMGLEAVLNSQPFSTTSKPSQRVLLPQLVSHNSDTQWVTGTWYALNDITPAVQALVNQTGWASGGAAGAVLKGTGQAWARKFIQSFDSAPATAPRLIVTFTP